MNHHGSLCREGGDIGLFISLKITFSYSLAYKLWGLFWLVGSLIVIVIYRRGNFVYHLCGSTSIYYPLSYPFISLLSVSTCLSINLVYLSHSSPCLPSPIPIPFCFPISFSYSEVAKIFWRLLSLNFAIVKIERLNLNGQFIICIVWILNLYLLFILN